MPCGKNVSPRKCNTSPPADATLREAHRDAAVDDDVIAVELAKVAEAPCPIAVAPVALAVLAWPMAVVPVPLAKLPWP